MRYINTKTGAIIDSSFKITGEHWKLEKPKVKKNKKTKATKKGE